MDRVAIVLGSAALAMETVRDAQALVDRVATVRASAALAMATAQVVPVWVDPVGPSWATWSWSSGETRRW